MRVGEPGVCLPLCLSYDALETRKVPRVRSIYTSGASGCEQDRVQVFYSIRGFYMYISCLVLSNRVQPQCIVVCDTGHLTFASGASAPQHDSEKLFVSETSISIFDESCDGTTDWRAASESEISSESRQQCPV